MTAAQWRRRLGACALALAAIVVALWLLDVSWKGRGGRGVPEALSRVVILAALAVGAGWLAASLVARVRGRRGRELAAALSLPALVALSLAVRFAGIESEVGGRYYLDEGTYYHHATAIDGGDLLTRTFVYPHLLYYADALTLWAAARFPAPVAALARRLYGLNEPLAVSWLLLRGVVALLSALTVVPVFKIAERLAPWRGRTAGALAAALLIFSGLYNEGSHLNTCDVPSAFFATVCLLFAARLAARESARDYAMAGIAAGLAAASKYPAVLVALAIAAVWVGWRLRRRDWNGGLAWAALAALGTVVAVMPSLLAYPDLAFGGERGVFFGARQYGRGGWLGVMPESNAAFYAGQLLWSFGWPAVAAGLSGLVLMAIRAARARRRREPRSAGMQVPGPQEAGRQMPQPPEVAGTSVPGTPMAMPPPSLPIAAGPRAVGLLWLAIYPAAFLVLIASMNMVVKRNLYPVLPILAVYLGVGIAAWLRAAFDRPGGGTALAWRLAAAALVLACLWLPAELTARQTIGYVSPTTREEAAAWIGRHLPPGASIVKESYTPDFPPGRFAVSHQRLAGRIPIPELRDPQNDYLLLSSAAYARFSDPAALFTDNQRQLARRYDEIFRTFPLVKEWVPGDLQLGPVLRLYRIDPDPAACLPAAGLPAADAFVSDESMRAAPERPLHYGTLGQWSLFRACVPAGRYRLGLLGEVRPPARVQVTDTAGAELAQLAMKPASAPSPPDGAAPAASPRPECNVRPAAGPTPQGSAPPAATAEIDLARPGKVLLYVSLGPGSRLRGVTVAPPRR
jgi:4-amino-4-deoxy-L-arabinose transferase-like glycosyltransferase